MVQRAVVAMVLAAGLVGAAGCSASGPATSTSPATTAASSPARAAGQQVAPRSIAVIGDSLTHQDGHGQQDLTTALVDAGWPRQQVCWSGVDGRTIVDTLPGGAPDAQAEVKRCRAQLGGEPQLWVIALVSNNLGDPTPEVAKDMRTLLGVLGPDAHVMWVNAGRSDLATQNILERNPVLQQTLAGRPHTVVADWFGFLEAHPDQQGWWQADGTHMTRAGYAQRNRFIAEQAEQAITQLG